MMADTTIKSPVELLRSLDTFLAASSDELPAADIAFWRGEIGLTLGRQEVADAMRAKAGAS
jgi:hypothetical protein